MQLITLILAIQSGFMITLLGNFVRILVTGTSGFVGSAIATRLKEQGIEVHGLSRTPSRANSVNKHIFHDIRQPYRSSVHYDQIVHCAALSTPWAHPIEFAKTNVIGTKNIIDFCNEQGLPGIVYISSSSVHYENKDQFLINEESTIPQLAINEYAKTKKQAEDIIKEYTGSWTVIRPRAVYGPGDTVLFPRILKSAKQKKFPILVRNDGATVYGDLIYIENLAYYVHRAIQLKAQGVYLVTNNEPVAIYDFLNKALKQLAYPIPKRKISVSFAMKMAHVAEWYSSLFMNYREPLITRFGVSVFAYTKTFNVNKCLETLGTPPYSNEEGLEKFINWWKKYER